jgi:hypothetical protein
MNIQPLANLARTHTCGGLTVADDGKDVVLLGWVHRLRDLGSLAFFDIRDRHGVTQVIARDNPALVATVQDLRPEYVVAVIGRVERRSLESVNPKLKTGEIEVELRELRLLNDARTPPFPIADEGPVSEDTRLKYRYLDLRRSRMQHNITLRHRATMEIRKYFDENGDEQPVPKSSMAMRTPSARSWNRVFRVASLSWSSTLSVISSSSRSGASPDAAKARMTTWTKPVLRNWTGDRLTATRMWSGQLRAAKHASRKAHSPSCMMKPISSASGMNSPGGINPLSGWRQRISASTPQMVSVPRSTTGW